MDDASPVTGPLRVLLVEDNVFDVELTTEALRQDRPCVITAVATGEEFERALGEEFDIVLSDFSLPGFSGIEALERVLERCPDTPFVFVSGVLGEEHAVEMLKRGATDYVVKSRLSRLPLVVNRAIAEARERRERRRAERALRASENTFSRVVESLQDYAVILLDAEGAIRSWNGAAQRIFGYSLDTVRGRSVAILYDDPVAAADGLQRELAQVSARGSTMQNATMRHRDGRTFHAHAVTTAFHDDDGQLSGFSRIVRDTSEERTAAEALEAAKSAAERANQAKDRFIAVLSHELRTPLVPIMTGTQLLEMSPSLPPDLRQILAMIRRNVALEARLIDDLLDVTSIERGKIVLDYRPVDIHGVLRAALETARDDSERKKLDLQLAFEAQRATMRADEGRLQQVFWNLIRNAVKFTPANGSIHIATRNDTPETVRIDVRDSGIGIQDGALQRIFSPFEQEDGPRVAGVRGLGLGLAIARGLVQKHGGQLFATSDGLGKGATFSVVLPVMPRAASPTASTVDTENTPDTARTAGMAGTAGGDGTGPFLGRPADDGPAAWGRGTDAHANGNGSGAHRCSYDILLVEDNPDSEFALRTALVSHGHRVVTVGTVREALDAVRSERFDVLVSDIGLPDGLGFEIAVAAADRIPAIAVSGYGMEMDIEASRNAGFLMHLTKPVEATHLLDRIDFAVRAQAMRSHAMAAPPSTRLRHDGGPHVTSSS